jgi:two-component system, NtrC family, response regulator AtoC
MSPPGPRVLIVARDAQTTAELCALVQAEGGSVERVSGPPAAYEVLDGNPIDLVLAEPDGADLLETLTSRWRGICTVALVADHDSEEARDALRAGATDCLPPEPTREQLRHVLDKATALAEHDATVTPSRLDGPGALLGDSRAMREALGVLDRAARSNVTVLIRGESGTGKELVARALHERSGRSSGPFVKIDCAALPEPLLESELFGYEKGAFTGASARKPGRVELADGGTLFLDEIGELGAPPQAKLLRLLQDRQFERLGGTATHSVDVRILAATHRDLETMTQRGEFRQDLFYRLNVVPIWLPPLRARRDDVSLLARHFCATLGAEHGKNIELSDGAVKLLRAQRWPGNVRQLQNFIERLVVLADSAVISERQVKSELEGQVDFVTEALTARQEVGGRGEPDAEVGRLSAELRSAERQALLRALESSAGNRTLAARMLGISRSHLYKKLAEHDLV